MPDPGVGITDPNAGQATFGAEQTEFRILALEGQGGLMRLRLGSGTDVDSAHLNLDPDETGTLEMHDGARFGVRVLERLSGGEYRVKLTGQV